MQDFKEALVTTYIEFRKDTGIAEPTFWEFLDWCCSSNTLRAILEETERVMKHS